MSVVLVSVEVCFDFFLENLAGRRGYYAALDKVLFNLESSKMLEIFFHVTSFQVLSIGTHFGSQVMT